MIYKIIMSSGPEVIIESEEDLVNFLKAVNNNSSQRLFVTKHGIVNPAYIVDIVKHKEKMTEFSDLLKLGRSEKEAASEACGTSLFAKLLSDKMSMLSPGQRTEAQEEAARLKRQN